MLSKLIIFELLFRKYNKVCRVQLTEVPCKVSHDYHILSINAYGIILIIFLRVSVSAMKEQQKRRKRRKRHGDHGGATMW